MKTILVTGTTGFLGSSLVADLLRAGMGVKALSRKDPGGGRTRAAVEAAARGFGLPLDAEHLARLSVVEVDFEDLEGTLDSRVFEQVSDVWNVAAEMSYSTRKVLQSVGQNVVASCTLYALAARYGQCQRFYHVSTAYVSGVGCPEAREQLHLTPKLINAYQLSKWMAELNLVQHQRELGLPLTLFRPSIIIGHQETGWSSGAPFGMFSLAELLLGGKRMGAAPLCLDVRGDMPQDLVCIDTVVERARALLTAQAHREPVEIFHCSADERLPLVEAIESARVQLGLSLEFGPSRTPVDVEINRLFAGNKPFADLAWIFHSERLKRVLGAAYVPRTTDVGIIRRSMRHYLSQRLRQLVEGPPAHSARDAARLASVRGGDSFPAEASTSPR